MLTLSKKNLNCGFGNRLFNYNFLSQIASYLNMDACVPSIMDKDYLNLNHATFKKRCNSIFLFDSVIKKNYYYKLSPQQRLNLIDEKKSKNIRFDGAYLGEFFFDHLYQDPKDLISLKTNLLPETRNKKVNVGVHFRGGDFHSWNPNAILDAQFYIDAIEFISCTNKDLEFYLVTDDNSLQSISKVKSHMKSSKYSFIETKGPMIEDFSILSYCKYIIASPSTFCIWASILGSERKIFLSKKWVNYSIARDDQFWVDLLSSKNKLLKVIDIL